MVLFTDDMLKLGLGSLIGAVVHVALVLIYANWANWGPMGVKNRVLGVPGGAMTVSPPVWEYVYYWYMPLESASGLFVAIVAGHMLLVRLLLNVAGLIAIVLRWFGIVDAVICMDNRTWAIAKNNSTCSNHTGGCGAFATLSFVGFTPGLAIIGLLIALGFNIPLWLAFVAAFPFFFVFGKHFHVAFFQFAADIFQITEIPGWFVGSLLAKSIPGWQFCQYSGHKHD